MWEVLARLVWEGPARLVWDLIFSLLPQTSRHGKNTFWFRRHNFETIYGSSITVGEAVKSINFYMYHSSDKVVDFLKLGKMYIIKLQKVVFIVVFAILAKL